MAEREMVFGCLGSPTCEDADLFKPRRFSDPVSPLNDMVYDKSRLLAQAVEMIDGLGIEILNVAADRFRNSRILVAPSRECNALEGVEFKRDGGWSHWISSRFGVEIVWIVPIQGAALVPSPEGSRV